MTIEECREYLPEGWIAPIQNDPVLREIFEAHEYDLEQEAVPPFLIQELRGGEMEAVSLNYLSGLLLRAAGLEGTGYTKYLEDLRQELPVITDIGYMDWEGSRFRAGEPNPYTQRLNEYAVLQYNNSFDDANKVGALFGRE